MQVNGIMPANDGNIITFSPACPIEDLMMKKAYDLLTLTGYMLIKSK
jgi:hypothetical protein